MKNPSWHPRWGRGLRNPTCARDAVSESPGDEPPDWLQPTSYGSHTDPITTKTPASIDFFTTVVEPVPKPLPNLFQTSSDHQNLFQVEEVCESHVGGHILGVKEHIDLQFSVAVRCSLSPDNTCILARIVILLLRLRRGTRCNKNALLDDWGRGLEEVWKRFAIGILVHETVFEMLSMQPLRYPNTSGSTPMCSYNNLHRSTPNHSRGYRGCCKHHVG